MPERTSTLTGAVLATPEMDLDLATYLNFEQAEPDSADGRRDRG